jgi:hypothetical protein
MESDKVYPDQFRVHLLNHLIGATRIYGSLARLTEIPIIDQLNSTSSLIIIQGEDWTEGSWSEICLRYQQLKPIPLSYFKEKYPKLICKVLNYTDKAIRAIGSVETPVKLQRNFLIIEKNNLVGLWLELSDGATYSEDLDLVRKYCDDFMVLYCLSAELKEPWQAHRYYELPEEDLGEWTLVQDREVPSEIKAGPPPILLTLGKMLFYGLQFAVEVKFGCLRCGRKSHTSTNCYARRDILGNLLG